MWTFSGLVGGEVGGSLHHQLSGFSLSGGGSLWHKADVKRGPPAGSVPGPPCHAHPLTSHLRLLTCPALLHAVLGLCRAREWESMRSWPSGPRPGAARSPRLQAGSHGHRAPCPELTAPHLHVVPLTVAGVGGVRKGCRLADPRPPQRERLAPSTHPSEKDKAWLCGEKDTQVGEAPRRDLAETQDYSQLRLQAPSPMQAGGLGPQGTSCPPPPGAPLLGPGAPATLVGKTEPPPGPSL